MDRLFPVLMTVTVIAIPVSAILSVSIGEIAIPFVKCYQILVYKLFGLGNPEFTTGVMSIIWLVRVPRTLMALCAGAGLSLCGVVMQSSVQNPLADPYILGTSSGASLGATASIMLGIGGVAWAREIGVSTSAFIGALGASALVLMIAGLGGRMTSVKLVLGGTVINMICGTFSSLIVYMFPSAEGMQTVSFWLMGSIQINGYGELRFIPILVIAIGIYFFIQSRIMNTMMLGDETAVTLGVSTAKHRFVYMAISSLIVGFLVTKCGIIGYVGLIVPHIARGFVGVDHRKLIPFSFCLGALFLLWCDVVARSALRIIFGSSGELPLGLITSVIGAPMLLYRITRRGFISGR